MELRFEPKFYREHLGEKSDHKSLIQDFQPTRPEGYGLTRYLQDQAFVDEESGNIRTYLIRQKGTGELVGYYSIRAGNILLRQNESTNVISGIELTNFAVNGKYRVRHPKVTMVGARIFYGFIMPQIREIRETLGVKILYIFALDQVPLLNYYKRLGFLSLQKQDEQFVYQTCKPSYDLTPPTIEIEGFLGGAVRFIAKPCLKQRVMRFPTIRYGCSAQ